MKIVHVVRQYLPSIGGMEEVVRSLAAYQLKSGQYQASVITLNKVFREPEHTLPSHEIIDGIPVTRLNYRGSERYPLAPQIFNAIKDADLVHVHGIDFFFDYLAATRLLHGKPLVASTHGGFFHTEFAQKLKRLYFNSVTRLSSCAYGQIIATSENDGALFSQVVAPHRLCVIENGVDIEKYHNAGSPQLKPTLIYFGRWSENKGIKQTMDIFAALRASQTDTPWQLIIAGREYDLNAAELSQYAEQIGITAHIRISPNPSMAELNTLIGEASYFICLSRHEGFGIAPIEAMSAGLTPILSDIPPFRRLLDNTAQGLLLEPATHEQQAQKIAALHAAQSASDITALRTAIQQSVQPYSWQGVEARYADAYQAILK